MPRKSKTLGRKDWISLAQKVLIQSGIEEVKVHSLARRLNVTRGSFYHHFTSHADLLDALLNNWETQNLVEIEKILENWRVSGPDFTKVVAAWLFQDPASLSFNLAVRNWARRAPRVDEIVRRIDASWIALLEKLFEGPNYSDDQRLVRARIIYFHQIGYYALAINEPYEERLRLVPTYYEALTGEPAGPELDDIIKSMIGKKQNKSDNNPAFVGSWFI